MTVLLEANAHGLHRTSLEGMDYHRTKWLDLNNPSEAEISKVADLVKIPKPDLKTFLDRDELPRVGETGHFSVVVCRSPRVSNHGKGVSTTAVAFLVSERLLITLHKDEVKSITETLDMPDKDLYGVLKEGTSSLFYRRLEHIMGDFFTRLDEVEDQIDRIEDSVFSNPDRRTVKRIFSLKRTLIYFHKSLSANRDVLVNLQKDEEVRHIKAPVRKRLSQLYYDVVQLIDVVATYRDILTGTLDIYLSTVSLNMNAVMKKMAAYGTIILLPTFITGLYGMNFKFMPELSWKYGYLFAWSVIILSVVVLVWYFKKHDWF